MQTHMVAELFLRNGTKSSHVARALQPFYETDFLPLVNTQLEKVRVRLVAVLNAALTSLERSTGVRA
jgi:hypothetical protein